MGDRRSPKDVRIIRSQRQSVLARVPKEAGASVRESEERLRALMTASSDVVYRMSPDWKEMRQLHGRDFIPDTNEPSHNWLEKYIHPDDRPHVTAVINEAIRTKNIFELEHRVLRVDGTLGWAFSRAIPLLDEKGAIVEWVGAASDITERKRAEEALRESEERLRLAKSAGKIGIHDYRPASGVLHWDDRLRELWGLGPDDKVDYGVFMAGIHPEDREATDAAVTRALDPAGDGACNIEYRLVRDGQTRWVAATGQASFEGGRAVRFVGTVQDITDRKQAEETITLANAYNRNLIEASIDPLVTIDQEGRISDANAATEKVTGYSRTELIGSDFSNYFTEPAKASDGYRRVFDEGLVRDYPLEIRHRDGHTTPVLYNASVYRDEAGRVVGVFAAARDMTDLKQLESQLRQAQKMEALGTLTGGIAHDFNNILAAIIGFTELVAGHAAKGSRDERHLARIMESSLRGRDLVRQMLTFSRKAEQDKKPLSLGTIVEETVKLIRATTPTTISIKVDTQSESGLILADPTQMQQVIMNLSTNAAHAMREKGGTLDIQLSDHSVSPSNGNPDGMKPGLYTRLTVRDTGAGMSPDIIDKIFDPFFTTKKLGEGTGLGLSVVHGIVKQSNGHIAVESKPDKGSIFTVYFPQITGELEANTVSDDELPTGSERILFVDDEEALVEMGEDILAELGYEVTSRMSSKEALALFTADPSRFDLIVTDQTMPEMTGLELAKEILALRADMPIIMCTGFSYLVDADKASMAGIKAFAMKPLTKREIAKTIRKVLDE